MRNDLLLERIESSGLKKSYIADKLGITRQGLHNKLHSPSWNAEQIAVMKEVLNLSTREVMTIFFS